MLISEAWLREWAALDYSTEELAENLTQAGLEVKTIEAITPLGDLLRVGEVVAIESHPNADKLQVCTVNVDGKAPLTIVCGAQNVAAGIKVPVALVGAILPGGLSVAERDVRGVSSAGMLCSSAELGLAEQSSGLLLLSDEADVGALVDDYLALDDRCIDIDLTPDRGDCLSIAGVARDIAAISDAKFTPVTVSAVEPSHSEAHKVYLAAPQACPRYVGRIIKNINAQAQTPDWMQERLRRVGLRSLDPVVDVTNYVMIELGQPMHAFDHAKIKGDITVRYAQSGEKLQLLDAQVVDVQENALLITDQSGPIALAGVMGGLDTAIDKQTTDIFLESAHFVPDAIAGRARALGLHTDASHRFERGVDPQLPYRACERASELLQQIVGGQYGEIVDTADPAYLQAKDRITLRPQRVNQILGLQVTGTQMQAILLRLGMQVVDGANESLLVTPPSWRFDISGEHDLVEEIGRAVGFDQIQPIMPRLHQVPANESEQVISALTLKQHLAAASYHEVVSYSFVDPADQNVLFSGTPAVHLTNPIADNMSQMRLSIWPGLLNTAKINQQRQHLRHRYFEIGNVFEPDSSRDTGVKETRKLAILLAGAKSAMHWSQPSELVDYFDLKGELDRLFSRFGLTEQVRYQRSDEKMLHPGQAAIIYFDGQAIGSIGALHPRLLSHFDLNQATYLAELDLSALSQRKLPNYVEISRFPKSNRDLAIVVDLQTSAQRILEEITLNGGNLLKNCAVFDTYTGDKVPAGQKSLAVSLTFQSNGDSVSSQQVDTAISSILSGLHSKYGAQLRT